MIDAGLWFGADDHYLIALTNDGTGDHVVLMMNPSAAAIATTVTSLEDIINGNPVDPLVQLQPGDAETIIIDRPKNQPVEWDTDIDQFFRYSSIYPNRVLPGLVINSGGANDITTNSPADFVLVKFSTGTVIGSASVETVPVPEPAAWLSLLAGGGLLALRLRSTRRRPSGRPLFGQ